MNKITKVLKRIKRILNHDFEKEEKITLENFTLLENKVNLLDLKINNILNSVNLMSNQVYDIRENFKYGSLETLSLQNKISDKKKILLCGFYGAFNLGDELMLKKILNLLANENYDITIMLCDNPYTDLTKYGEYKFIHYPKCRSDLNYIASYFDVLVFGGGALIDDFNYDKYDSQMTLGYILINLTMRFITFNKKTILYGLSSNSTLENKEFIEKLDYIINNCFYFSLRDTNSLEVLNKSGINTNKIKIVDDIVFSYDFSHVKRKQNAVKKLGIVYITSFDDNNYLIEHTKKILNYLHSKKINFEISFIPFYNYLGSDEKVYNEIKQVFDKEKIKVINYKYDFDSIKEVFLKQDYIISMRYHGSLIANALGIPCLSLIYKHRHYINKMKYLHDKYKFKKNISYDINDDVLDKLFFEKQNSIDCVKISQTAEKDLKILLKKI